MNKNLQLSLTEIFVGQLHLLLILNIHYVPDTAIAEANQSEAAKSNNDKDCTIYRYNDANSTTSYTYYIDYLKVPNHRFITDPFDRSNHRKALFKTVTSGTKWYRHYQICRALPMESLSPGIQQR
jgi:hypothetical protein